MISKTLMTGRTLNATTSSDGIVLRKACEANFEMHAHELMKRGDSSSSRKKHRKLRALLDYTRA